MDSLGLGAAASARPVVSPRPPPNPRGCSRPLPPVPGTEIREKASGWLSVSTLTCRNALHTGLCRCLQPRGTPVSSWGLEQGPSLTLGWGLRQQSAKLRGQSLHGKVGRPGVTAGAPRGEQPGSCLPVSRLKQGTFFLDFYPLAAVSKREHPWPQLPGLARNLNSELR